MYKSPVSYRIRGALWCMGTLGVGGLEEMPVFCWTYGDLVGIGASTGHHVSLGGGHGWSFEWAERGWPSRHPVSRFNGRSFQLHSAGNSRVECVGTATPRARAEQCVRGAASKAGRRGGRPNRLVGLYGTRGIFRGRDLRSGREFLLSDRAQRRRRSAGDLAVKSGW